MIRIISQNENWKLIISILIFAVVVGFSGCLESEPSIQQKTQGKVSVEETEGTILVNKYMTLVSSGNIEDANKLLSVNSKSEIKSNSTLHKTDGDSPNLPWSSILYERNLILAKIIGAKSENEKIQVYTTLENSKIQDVNFSATFYLIKESDTLLINDIELKPGKNN